MSKVYFWDAVFLIWVLQTVQRHGVYSAAYGTVHYKEPLKSFERRVGHSLGFGLPSVAILPWLCRKPSKAIFIFILFIWEHIASSHSVGWVSWAFSPSNTSVPPMHHKLWNNLDTIHWIKNSLFHHNKAIVLKLIWLILLAIFIKSRHVYLTWERNCVSNSHLKATRNTNP